MKFYLILFSIVLALANCPAKADNVPAGNIQKAGTTSSEALMEAQEKLMNAKGSYNTARQQESALENMRKAAKLSLKAAKLRSRAEKLQTKADSLVEKASHQAVSRGLYITNPLLPVNMQKPPSAEQTAKKPTFVPVPGQSINIIAPKANEVSYSNNQEQGNSQESSEEYLPDPPTVNNF